ncbi:hypothetical protein B566_EDAN004975 [Ephemera danica]|nr:hypothetical protein B566_EDAN004975 [Ephemera danica]
MMRYVFAMLFVIAAVYAHGKRDYYWTNGHNVGGDTFEWGTSGVQFTANDQRWANNEPMDGNPDLPNEHVSLHVQNMELASDPNSYANKVVCEMAA